MTRKGNQPQVSAAYEEIIERMEAGEPISLSARPGAFEVGFGPRIATVPEQTWLAVLGAARRYWVKIASDPPKPKTQPEAVAEEPDGEG